MPRLRVWIFTALVGLALLANLGLLSPRIAQTAEENVRARLASASAGLRTELELLDARISPRGLAQNADLIEALRPSADGAPAARPDEKALRAAAAVASPEPDLVVVANAAGAIVSRRGKAAVQDDLSGQPALKALLEAGASSPGFIEVDKQLHRVAVARVPGGAGAVLTGALIDDRFALQLRSTLDADVAFFDGGALSASSVPAGPRRDELVRWEKSPGPGYGTLEVKLPLVGRALTGKLPRGTARFAVRGAVLPLGTGVQAAVTLSAAPYLAWLARYQAFYLCGLMLLCLFGLFWGLLPSRAPEPAPQPAPAPRRREPSINDEEPQVSEVRRRPRHPDSAASRAAASLVGADVSVPLDAAPARLPPTDVPWSPPQEEHAGWANLGTSNAAAGGQAVRPPRPPESLDPDMPAAPPKSEPAGLASAADAASYGDPLWAGDPLSTPGTAFAPPLPVPDDPWAEATPAAEAAEPGFSAPLAQDEAIAAEAPAEEEELVAEVPAQPTAPPPPAQATTRPPSEFDFAGLLDEGQAGSTAAKPQRAGAASSPKGEPDSTQPGAPVEALLNRAPAGAEEPAAQDALEKPYEGDYFPGNEPTRIQPVSAALLDKLREKDLDEGASAAQAGKAAAPGAEASAHAEETAPAAQEPAQKRAAPAASGSDMTLNDFSFTRPAEEEDPDEAHFHETFEQFLALRAQTGEGPSAVSYEKFAAKLRKNRQDMREKHGARGVRFVVYIKEGKAAIKASAIR